jgi:hypothetical protein
MRARRLRLRWVDVRDAPPMHAHGGGGHRPVPPAPAGARGRMPDGDPSPAAGRGRRRGKARAARAMWALRDGRLDRRRPVLAERLRVPGRALQQRLRERRRRTWRVDLRRHPEQRLRERMLLRPEGDRGLPRDAQGAPAGPQLRRGPPVQARLCLRCRDPRGRTAGGMCAAVLRVPGARRRPHARPALTRSMRRAKTPPP